MRSKRHRVGIAPSIVVLDAEPARSESIHNRILARYQMLARRQDFGPDERLYAGLRPSRPIAIASGLAFVALIIGLAVFGPLNRGAERDTMGVPPAVGAPAPARPGEKLFLVAEFTRESGPTVDVSGGIARALVEALTRQPLPSARIARLADSVENDSQAQALLDLYHAQVVIWGSYNEKAVSPHYSTPLVPLWRTDERLVLPQQVISTGFSPPGATGNNLLYSFTAAHVAYLVGANDQARLLLDDMIASSPDNGPGWWLPYFTRGFIRQMSGNLAGAIADYNQAIGRQPALAEALNNRAVAYESLGQRDQALTDLSNATEIQPELAQAWLNLALVNLPGDPAKALSDLNMAINLVPSYHLALIDRGDVYVSTGNYDQAALDYTRAIQVAPDEPGGYVRRGRVQTALLHYDEAIADFQQALTLDPSNPDASLNLGLTYLAQNQLDPALKQFQQTALLARQVHRKDVEAYALYYGGLCYVRKGMYQEALDYYRQSLPLAEQLGDLKMIAQLHNYLNQVEQALGTSTP